MLALLNSNGAAMAAEFVSSRVTSPTRPIESLAPGSAVPP